MERTETTQTTEQRSEAQGKERQERERSVLNEVREKVGLYNKRFQHEVLSAAIEEVQPTIDAADKLAAMESRVRAIYAGLDSRTKALFVVLFKLTGVEGQSVGVDYGIEIGDDFLNDTEYVEQALKEHPKDADLKFLGEVYRLARIITEDLGRAELGKEESAAETPEESPKTPMVLMRNKESEAEPEQGKGEPGLGIIKKWMAERMFSEKLTAILLWQLSNKGSSFAKPDDDYPDELFWAWEKEVIEASEDPVALNQDNDGLSEESRVELMAVTMKCATWIPVEV